MLTNRVVSGYPSYLQEKATAQGFANALATIGKFALKKKAGDKDQLYGRWVNNLALTVGIISTCISTVLQYVKKCSALVQANL